MADSAARAQRAAALEEKRRRLEELKKRRTRRDEDTAAVKASATANLDDYIDGLLSQPAAAAASKIQDKENEETAEASLQSQAPVEEKSDDKSTQSAASNVIAEPAPAPPPKVVETFAVGTQTDNEDFPEKSGLLQDEEENNVEGREEQTVNGAPKPVEDVPPEEERDPKVLSTEEIEKEIKSVPFTSFINTASKKVERMLGAPILDDLLADFVGEKDGVQREQKDSDESRFLSSRQVFECPKWTSNRDVTDLDWSVLHRELMLSTYHMPMSTSASSTLSKGAAAVSAVSPNDTMSSSLTPRSGELQSDGLALVWSLTMPTRPEHIFTCGSPVTTGRFHPSESPLVIGGCESGQLVVWDVRAGRLPVQKSVLMTMEGASSKGHSYPIGSMEITEGGLGLVTYSTDGRVNFWSLANLREPAESIQVGDSISCFAVTPESEGLLLGDENGAIYSVQSSSQGQRSSRKQVRKLDSSNAEGENVGHYGMVTSISTKSSRAAGLSKGFLRGSGGLVLSSGVDWTVKLWAPAVKDSPLISMVSHSYDYMSDVKWSPTHPSLFATASSNGSVGLWNLASSFEEPLTGQEGLVVEPDAMSGRGVSKLKWSSDGRRVMVASADRLHVLNLTEDVARAKGDEDSKLMTHLMARGLISRQAIAE